MFRNAQSYRTFLTVLITYTLDLVGFSIVFPVLAPLLLNPHLHFFDTATVETTRTTILGVLFSIFGIAQFLGAPVAGALADRYGRYKTFLWTIGVSIIGYSLMALSVFEESIIGLFLGRILTGFCSGNIGLAQSATADLTEPKYRSKAFGILLGVGGLGFIAGPWFGGKLANPDWLYGSGAFIFAAVAALLNFLMVFFFFVETWKRKKSDSKKSLLSVFKDIQVVFHYKTLRQILSSNVLFCIGWAFLVVFFPTFLVQKFSLSSDKIGDIYAYQAIAWFFISMFLNKALASKFSLRSLILFGSSVAAVGVALCVAPSGLWPYWFIIPFSMVGGALAWINYGALLSTNASADMQGRAMGVGGSMWSVGQIVAPLIAGPLAGWNIYSPLLTGALFILFSLLFFFCSFPKKSSKLKDIA